ncbi:hypothetical protein M758_12G117800 [Ceratodon purpureus]|nr:hypothetical protein M758_12G117800 [Ceratodon purpureus]
MNSVKRRHESSEAESTSANEKAYPPKSSANELTNTTKSRQTSSHTVHDCTKLATLVAYSEHGSGESSPGMRQRFWSAIWAQSGRNLGQSSALARRIEARASCTSVESGGSCGGGAGECSG